jgi:four helix bundle protein
MEGNNLNELEIYQLARRLSQVAWTVYDNMHWQDKKVMGEQFIRSVDSIGANIAEGHGRYHYLDKIKFFYNSRGSLYESCRHWLELLSERNKIDKQSYTQIQELFSELAPKLNSFIRFQYNNYNHKNNKYTN